MAKYMTIDGIKVEFDKEKNILTVVRNMGIELPTFCYYPELSVYGACRMCVVEDEWGGIIASCSTPPKDGMVIKTNTPKLFKYRKMVLELLLSSHCRDCLTCEKNGDCKLQELADRFGIRQIRFKNDYCQEPKDSSVAIVRDPSKCILCGDCIRTCSEVQNVGAIDFVHRGSRTVVSPAFGKSIADSNCVNCGQCAAVCPTGAITVKTDHDAVWKTIHRKEKPVVAQIAPAVRVAVGEAFGMQPGENVIGKIVAAMKIMGFDYVYDTSVTADLTIMEETKELVERLSSPDAKMPMFTSCCPGWIRYAELNHPDLLPNISTCKSPMQMFGAVLKEHFKKEQQTDIVSVAIMPCTAKKYEAQREEFIRDGIKDVDYVLTTKELIRMIKEIGIDFENLSEADFDEPFKAYSGAGVIFGVTGGVTEAAVRKVVEDKSDKALEEIKYTGLRDLKGVKVSELPLGDRTLRIAVVSGLSNAENLIQKIKSGEEKFDFVEVMACPKGCIGGGGQPVWEKDMKAVRAEGIAKADETCKLRHSEMNPVMKDLYDGLLKDRVHELLHVKY